MKFAYVTSALVATLSVAQPIDESVLVNHVHAVPVQNVTLAANDGEIVERGEIEKRNTAYFTVYPNSNCGSDGTWFDLTGSGVKGNFGTPQHSIYITKLANNYHLTMYTGLDQSGIVLRETSANVGQCWAPDVPWLSYGLYAN